MKKLKNNYFRQEAGLYTISSLVDIFQVRNNCNLKVTLGRYKERSVHEEQKANIGTEIILQSIIRATSGGRNVYLEFCSHAVWVAREKRSEETDDPLSCGARL